MAEKEYSPQDLFAGTAEPEESPRVIIAPHRYIQGKDVIDHLGRYISTLNSKNPILFITRGGEKRVGDRIKKSLGNHGIKPTIAYFGSECSMEEVDRHVKTYQNASVDCLVAVGGGKCLDTGKAVAHRLSIPTVICPTLASTDAPCSAVSVMYTPDGVFDHPWFFPHGPSFVIVDTGIIANAPLRHLVSGMGDALATYYEAKTCLLNPKARTMVGARPTATAHAIAKLGAEMLYENGVAAAEAIKSRTITEALENVIEANTLISGVGFESGGLAASHGIAQNFSAVSFIEENYLHGEMVAVGIICHMCLEQNYDEAKRVAEFCAKVGLPVHFGQLSLDLEKHTKEIDRILDETMNVFFMYHEPFEVTREKVHKALIEAHQIGLDMVEKLGDQPYREIHT